MIKGSLIIAGSLICAGLLLYFSTHRPAYGKNAYAAVVVRENNTWMYLVYKNRQLIIRQETIPAVPGHQPFADSAQAARVAARVLARLLNHQTPTVSREELETLGIVVQHDQN